MSRFCNFLFWNFFFFSRVDFSFYNFFSLILILISIAVIGIILCHRTLLNLILFFELILLNINLLFIIWSVLTNDIIGQIFCLFTLAIAAVEVSILLAFIIILFRVHENIEVETLIYLKS